MKSDTARKVTLALIVVLTGTSTLAQAAGAKDFGDRREIRAEGQMQPDAGAKDFGDR